MFSIQPEGGLKVSVTPLVVFLETEQSLRVIPPDGAFGAASSGNP